MGLGSSTTKRRFDATTDGLVVAVMLRVDRLRSLMADQGLSQSELARRVGVTQATIYKLVSGRGYGSKYLHLIARELSTSPAYLTGEIDNPAVDAPQPAPAKLDVHHVMMAVALPSERALSRMFESFLEIIEAFPDQPDLEETARLLAQWLPIGLSQLRDLLPEAPPAAVAPEIRKELAEALATNDRGPRR